MGFMELLGSFSDAVITEQIRQLSNDELIEKWKSTCNNVNIPDYCKMLQSNGTKMNMRYIYDEEVERRGIAFRYNIKTLKSQCREYLHKLNEKEKENREKEDFTDLLKNSAMSRIIVDTINRYNYDVYKIKISAAAVSLYDFNAAFIYRIQYNSYNYPNLTKLQRTALGEYLEKNLKIEYVEKNFWDNDEMNNIDEHSNDNEIILYRNEADPRIKKSW